MYMPSSYRSTAGWPLSSTSQWSGDGENSATRGSLTTCACGVAANARMNTVASRAVRPSQALLRRFRNNDMAAWARSEVSETLGSLQELCDL